MSLAYAVSRLQGYSTNYFRLETVNQSTAGAFDVITLNFPVNSLVNMKSLSLHCDAKLTGVQNDAGTPATFGTLLGPGSPADKKADVYPYLPRLDQLITRIELYAGGQQLQSGFQQYNTVSSVMHNLYSELQHTMSYERVQMNSEMVVETDVKGYYNEPRPYILNNFMSFVGQSEPSYLDTSLMPQIQMRIYLAGPEVLGASPVLSGADPTGATTGKPGEALTDNQANTLISKGGFELSNLFFTVENIVFADALYDRALESRIAEVGFLEVPFANYFTFFQGNNSQDQSTRFSLSSQSINKLIAVQRPENYRSKPRGIVKMENCCGPAFQPHYFNFQSGRLASWQFNVNNLYIPNYRAGPLTAYNLHQICKADNYDSTRGDGVFSRTQWFNNMWAAVVRLNMPMAGMDSRNLSGLDSRGLASQMYYQTVSESDTNSAGYDDLEPINPTYAKTAAENGKEEVTIIACCTSTLMIGPGRQISVTI